jgi:hypothetical protein
MPLIVLLSKIYIIPALEISNYVEHPGLVQCSHGTELFGNGNFKVAV